MGSTFTSLTNYVNEHNSEYELTVKEPLIQSVFSIQAIQTAVQTQQEQRAAYLYAVSDMELKEKARLKEPGDLTKKTKYQESEEKAELEKKQYDEVNERLLDNYLRFKRERDRDMRNILVGLVTLQSTLHKKSGHSLNELLEKIKGLQPPAVDENEILIETLGEEEEGKFVSRQVEEV